MCKVYIYSSWSDPSPYYLHILRVAVPATVAGSYVTAI